MSYLTGGFLVGEVRNYAGSAAPAGWLFCYGQTVSKNDYPELFDIIDNTKNRRIEWSL